MRTTLTASRSSARASQVSGSPLLKGLARAGLAARGVIYMLIGWVAILVAFGQTRHQPNQQGALELLAHKPYGLVSLWLLGLGFAAYALWQLSQAAFGVSGEGMRAAPRLKCLGSAVIYAFLAYLTFHVIVGSAGSETRKQQDLTAQVMHHAGGRWLVGIAGLIIVVIGAVLALRGVRKTFMKYLQTARMSPRTRRIVERLGVIGSVARGVVFAIVGALVIDAAITHKAAKSGGLDKALLALRHQPYGQVLLVVVAIGLVVFGIYGLCEVRWRRV